MKWHAINIYLKVATMVGILSALLLAAGADMKW